MSNAHMSLADSTTGSGLPVVRKIGPADLKDALSRGLADFWAMPTHIVFLGLIYPIVGLVLARLVFGYDVLPLLFPLAAGFALIGPFAALGLYELSRRREAGLDVAWRHAFDVVHSPSIGAILALGGLLLILFLVWIAVADRIYVATFGYASAASMPGFIDQVFNTPEGIRLILVGNGVGFLFAVAALMISVISFPLLLDRPVSPAVAILTSARVVLANPLTMALWGVIVAALLVVGSLPFFLGLAVVVPVLGHATWHLYRKAVAPP
ncbi:MAG: DUF2189 domain-containing protein [Bauldia sp.]|uniref:DUF2189 domain-containing protein n=1 Tax=Bauldia sp. TaxID=2575872 RepID=UPI001D3B2FEF|nr:DUF2189 domain-containing protein [Bauldia sp.]MCB1494895.1 DUF2189 domain-containing protein [Bauldia sp.]